MKAKEDIPHGIMLFISAKEQKKSDITVKVTKLSIVDCHVKIAPVSRDDDSPIPLNMMNLETSVKKFRFNDLTMSQR